MKRFAGFLVAAAVVAGCASMDGAPVKSEGGVLTGDNGMTLYTFDKDSGGKSVCNGPCAANWPPLIAKADAKPGGEFSLITRDDGAKQWAWKGKPLYYFAKDQKPGDKAGDGFLNNAWHVIKTPSY